MLFNPMAHPRLDVLLPLTSHIFMYPALPVKKGDRGGGIWPRKKARRLQAGRKQPRRGQADAEGEDGGDDARIDEYLEGDGAGREAEDGF